MLTKVAAKKTAGVLGDDLALNAQQVTGVARRSRAAGGLGGGQGLAREQGDPGAGGAGDQRPRALGRDAAADGWAARTCASKASRNWPTSSCTAGPMTRRITRN